MNVDFIAGISILARMVAQFCFICFDKKLWLFMSALSITRIYTGANTYSKKLGRTQEF